MQNRAPTSMSGNEGLCYPRIAKTSPQTGSVTQPVSAPMFTLSGIRVQFSGEYRLWTCIDPGSEPDAQRDALSRFVR
jgi:hypothetical protein